MRQLCWGSNRPLTSPGTGLLRRMEVPPPPLAQRPGPASSGPPRSPLPSRSGAPSGVKHSPSLTFLPVTGEMVPRGRGQRHDRVLPPHTARTGRGRCRYRYRGGAGAGRGGGRGCSPRPPRQWRGRAAVTSAPAAPAHGRAGEARGAEPAAGAAVRSGSGTVRSCAAERPVLLLAPAASRRPLASGARLSSAPASPRSVAALARGRGRNRCRAAAPRESPPCRGRSR